MHKIEGYKEEKHSNRKIARLLERGPRPSIMPLRRVLLHRNDNRNQTVKSTPTMTKETYYHSVSYQAGSWTKPRRVCIQSTREAGELLFNHTFLFTSFTENILPKRVFGTYNKRGAMENYIKKTKNSFYFDKTDSPRFIENHARMMISVIAYNIINFMRTICFEKELEKSSSKYHSSLFIQSSRKASQHRKTDLFKVF